MDEHKISVTPDPSPRATPPAAVPKRVYAIDGRERVLLPLAWALGALAVHVLLCGPNFFSPALGLTALVGAWYAVLFWYAGAKVLEGRESRLLFAAVALLALTYAVFANQWFRLWNMVALALLMAVQLFAFSGAAELDWSTPLPLLERPLLLVEGLFCNLGAPLRTLGSIRGFSHKRTPYVVGGLAVGMMLLILVVPMLMSADVLFRSIADEAIVWLTAHLSTWAFLLVGGLFLAPFCFGLLYALRHPLERKEGVGVRPLAVEAAAPITVLAVMDALYFFFLAVQFYALFGGRTYLENAGISYADYARSGFFQLVAVAAINLTLVLFCVKLCKREGRGFRAVKLLSTALIAMSGVLLVSAALRMSLYVAQYGLSFKRALTYWGMTMLAVCFVMVLLGLWRQNFSLVKVMLTAAVTGWLVLNFANVDGLVTRYNIARGLDLYAVVSVAVDDTGLINPAALPAIVELAAAHPEEDWLPPLVAESRQRAEHQVAHWQNWSVTAQWAAVQAR